MENTNYQWGPGAAWVEANANGEVDQAREWAKIILERTGKKMEEMSKKEIFALIDKWSEEEPDNRAFWPI